MHDMTLRNSRMVARLEMIFRRHPIRSDMSNVYRNVELKLLRNSSYAYNIYRYISF